MADSSQAVGTTREGLLTTIWLFTSIALILFCLKLVVRHTIQHKIYWDDFFAAMATLILLASAILYTFLIPVTYEQLSIMTGNGPQLSETDQYQLSLRSQHLLIPLQALFWTGLWCVKFSFLFLYKLVLCHTRFMCTVWWICAAFMLLTYGVLLIPVFGQCGLGGDIYNIAQCTDPANAAFGRRMIWVEFAFVVATDLIVIILPLPLLWTLNISRRQKLALTPMFCLALVCIAFDTLRSVEQDKGSLTLGLLWTSLESEMAVIVCLLPTFRLLVSDSGKGKEYRRRLFGAITLRSLSLTGEPRDGHTRKEHSPESHQIQ